MLRTLFIDASDHQEEKLIKNMGYKVSLADLVMNNLDSKINLAQSVIDYLEAQVTCRYLHSSLLRKFSNSKGRLASILSEQQRSDLSKAMANQTIKALIQSSICDSITLVTNDPDLDYRGHFNIFY